MQPVRPLELKPSQLRKYRGQHSATRPGKVSSHFTDSSTEQITGVQSHSPSPLTSIDTQKIGQLTLLPIVLAREFSMVLLPLMTLLLVLRLLHFVTRCPFRQKPLPLTVPYCLHCCSVRKSRARHERGHRTGHQQKIHAVFEYQERTFFDILCSEVVRTRKGFLCVTRLPTRRKRDLCSSFNACTTRGLLVLLLLSRTAVVLQVCRSSACLLFSINCFRHSAEISQDMTHVPARYKGK